MARADSLVDADILARARGLLAEPPPRVTGVGPALAAAVLFAACAMGLAVAMVVAPANVTTPLARPGV
jgi:hypothetical protein